MKTVVILAAGIGSRLRPITQEVPKSLVKVAGVPLLERLTKQILKHNNSYEIIVVAGYLSEQIKSSMHSIHESIKVIVNEEFETTNNMESCRLALESTDYKDCIIVNADCIYEESIVHTMLESEFSCIATDSSEYFDENMKVNVVDGRVSEISKELPDIDGIFTSIDIYNFIKKDVNILLEFMRGYHSRGDLQKWNEVAINDMVKVSAVATLDFNGKRWMEVDNHDDLAKAEDLFK
ncbi:phosphocholine cytidylyltransferase family protein [Vibrio vulnificus]|nr:phosphocholine cytidylyltransferase family protein [Vibrio vulnificus]